MLKPVKVKKTQRTTSRFAIVASRYNARYVDSMVAAAKAELRRAGANKVQVIRVPGAFEIPVVAARLARATSFHASRITDQTPLSAILCLGVILRGQTTHAALIADSITHALVQIQVRYEIPVIHEVLLLENEEQARARCLDPKHNRGAEAAQTALAMAQLMRKLPSV
jgi:6,7-dimethyl-8-ribityllumazine synthase